MRPDWPERELQTRVAERVGRLLASGTPAAASTEGDDQQFDHVEQRLARRVRTGRRARSALVLAGALLVAGGSYFALGRATHVADSPITYRVAAGPATQQGAVVSATAATTPTEVAFSDGTKMRLEPRSQGRILELDRRGGRVALDQGKARVDVHHRPNARWVFQAGPFEVRVHGTSFSVAWNPGTARFDLHMNAGVVSVAGPISGGEMVLRAGESLSVTLDHGAAAPAVAERAASGESPAVDHPAPSEAPPPTAMPALAPAPTAMPAPAPAPTGGMFPPAAARPRVNWRAELAAGHARAIVADAERLGTTRALESVDSEDLAALADAARYVGNEELARRTLQTQRRRFPRSSRAAQAAFLLGRLEDESAAGAERALTWYDHYLSEAPSGAYAAEALGRKMMVLERARRHDEAVAIAVDYLRRFPSGSYAHAARVLVTAAGQSEAPGKRAP